MQQGDRVRVTAWAPSASYNENEHCPTPIEGTVEDVVDNRTRAFTSQVAWIRFDNGARLCVLDEDTFEVLS